MIQRYTLPIRGTLLSEKPLAGGPNDPICPFPITDLPDRPTYYDEQLGQDIPIGFRLESLDYNIDEGWVEIELDADQAVHNWLQKALKKTTGTKSMVEKTCEGKGYKLIRKDLKE